MNHSFTECLFDGGVQRHYKFDNGYVASAVRSAHSYGGPKGLWEIAVLLNDSICYTTPITSDVVGHLTPARRDEVLDQIAALEPAV